MAGFNLLLDAPSMVVRLVLRLVGRVEAEVSSHDPALVLSGARGSARLTFLGDVAPALPRSGVVCPGFKHLSAVLS